MPYTNEEILSALRHSEIAGGEQYDSGITREDADVVVTSASEFKRHCDDSGKVVWIPGNESIDLSSWSGTVRATIASDRSSVTGSGALVYTTSHGHDSSAYRGGAGIGVLQMRGSGALTGLRYRGPYHDYYDDDRYPGYIPLDSGDASERAAKRRERSARGMKIHSSDVEIENCEIWGWPNQAIQMGSRGSYGGDPHIHHNYIHDCMMVGFGYGVSVLRGHPLVEYCYFDATRHSIDGFGHEDAGYTLENCVFGPSTYSHAVDMHCLSENGYSDNHDKSSSTWRGRAGGRMEIRRNTFCFEEDIRGNGQEAVTIRGVPEDVCLIENNRFMHESRPSYNPGSSQGDAWRQHNLPAFDVDTDSEGYANFEYRDNQFDSENNPWTPEYGAPIDLENPSEGGRGEPDASLPEYGPWGDLSPERRRALVQTLQNTSRTLQELRDLLA